MGILRKSVFSQFAEFECERQLFITLSEDNSDWREPEREIIPLDRIRRPNKQLMELGRSYEDKIYSALSNLDVVKFRTASTGRIDKTPLIKQRFERIYEELRSNPREICLLEYEFLIPEEYVSRLLGNSKAKRGDLANSLRPDILILTPFDKNDRYLDRLGQIKSVSKLSGDNQYGINIVDIKASSEDSIGKKQFVEILYYAFTLNAFLMAHNLDDKFYVKVDGNGILPNIQKIYFTNLNQLRDKVVELDWENSVRIYTQIVNKISQLKEAKPVKIEDVELNLQPICGRCQYLEDCKVTLGYNKKERDSWSVELLPYTSKSIAEQLKEKGMDTVGQVHKNISDIEFGNTPEPLFAELPFLKLKTKAILDNKEVYPRENEVYSVAIPKYSEMNLIVNAEEDPIHERVYALGFYGSFKVFKNAKYREKFNFWWRSWKDYLDGYLDIEEVVEEINDRVIQPQINISLAKSFAKALRDLSNLKEIQNNIFEIILPGDELSNGEISKRTFVNIAYTQLNAGLTEYDEQNLAKQAVIKLNQMLLIAEFIEYYIKHFRPEKDQVFSPVLAIYYWSNEILDAIQNMLQRNLRFLALDEDTKRPFERLIQWFSPTEAQVQHPDHYKKVFDLRLFVETTLGFPTVINYTWHEIAERRYGFKMNNYYFTQNFNYMDFQVWHDYLADNDPTKQAQRQEKVRGQILLKLRTLYRLQQDFQNKSRFLISDLRRPIRETLIRSSKLSRKYHPIAQLWYLYSKLTGTVDELEKVNIRTMYPEFSIGKLLSAKITELEMLPGDTQKRKKYRFKLKGMSSNMKVKEGDSVLLLPVELRDQKVSPYKWKIRIDEMVWNGKEQCYNVLTENGYCNIEEQLKKYDITPSEWYIFPKSMDAWTNKLFGDNGLLQRCNFGISWLGWRLSAIWDIAPGLKLQVPESLEFNTPEVYLFLPDLVNKMELDVPNILQTNVKYDPDPSQTQAIISAFKKPLSIVHGPPGTGKSQTIVALIDDAINRWGNEINILVTTFSYPAMEVILQKLLESEDKSGSPTKAAQFNKVFLRSSFRDEINVSDYKLQNTVYDLFRDSKTNWKLNGEPLTKANKLRITDKIDRGFILFSNAHQLHRLREKAEHNQPIALSEDFYFDLIIVDEASQLPTDFILSSLQFVKPGEIKIDFDEPIYDPQEDLSLEELKSILIKQYPENLTRVVIVGDHNQLPPVQPVKPPKQLKRILGGLFDYLVGEDGHRLPSVQLSTNYRSNQKIVDYTAALGFYKNLLAFEKNANLRLSSKLYDIPENWIREILDPGKIVGTLIHDANFEIAVSNFEADIVVNLLISYYQSLDLQSEGEQLQFWKEEVGIVSPHNAHGRLIIRKTFNAINSNSMSKLESDDLMRALKETIYSVEKFQGSDRNFIIATIGISSKDQLRAEEDFIYDLTRFNVITSRAKSKILVICSQNFLDYMPRQQEILENSSKIRKFALEFCNQEKLIEIPFEGEKKQIKFRWRKP